MTDLDTTATGSSGQPEPVGTRGRIGAVLLLVTYLLVLAWVLLWPSAEPATEVVARVTQWLHDRGLPGSVLTGNRVEFVLNTVMIAPGPFLAMLVWPRWRWEQWTAYGFVFSGSVELFQGLFLPQRAAQMPDVVANTLGTLIGAVVATVLLGNRSQRARGPST